MLWYMLKHIIYTAQIITGEIYALVHAETQNIHSLGHHGGDIHSGAC